MYVETLKHIHGPLKEDIFQYYYNRRFETKKLI